MEDLNNQIVTSNTIVALGKFKYSLDDSLAIVQVKNTQLMSSQKQSAQSITSMKVVADPRTGRIGLTNGQLIIKYAEGVIGADLALDYGLSIITELASINRVVVQVGDLAGFAQLNETLRSDDRVVSTELDIYYGDHKPN